MYSKAKYGKTRAENTLEQNNKQVQGMVCVISPWVQDNVCGLISAAPCLTPAGRLLRPPDAVPVVAASARGPCFTRSLDACDFAEWPLCVAP